MGRFVQYHPITVTSRVELVQDVLVEHRSDVEREVPGHHSTDKVVPCLIERHFPERIPPPERKAKPIKRYVVCFKQGKRRETVFWCPHREAGLYVEGCLEIYHTDLNFKVQSLKVLCL
jgi:hypothetical protein